MYPDSISWAAFSVPQGKYEWLVMPFGYKNAPQVFQRRIYGIFRKYSDFCLVYIDDVLIASHTEEDHIEHLRIIIAEFDNHGIIISHKKMLLFQEEIDFIGVHIKHGKISPLDHITKKILNFSDKINDIKQLQSFLGLLNCDTYYLTDLAEKRRSLTTKLKGTEKTNPFNWTKDDIEIMTKQKEEFKNILGLEMSNAEDIFIVETYASDK